MRTPRGPKVPPGGLRRTDFKHFEHQARKYPQEASRGPFWSISSPRPQSSPRRPPQARFGAPGPDGPRQAPRSPDEPRVKPDRARRAPKRPDWAASIKTTKSIEFYHRKKQAPSPLSTQTTTFQRNRPKTLRFTMNSCPRLAPLERNDHFWAPKPPKKTPNRPKSTKIDARTLKPSYFTRFQRRGPRHSRTK